MSSFWDGKNERRKYPLPLTPGNYPKNLLNFINNNRNNQQILDQIQEPKRNRGIVLAADIRNFTKTMGHSSYKNMLVFLSNFLTHATDIIHESGGYSNKFLGDGLLAHFDDDKDIVAVEVAEEIIRVFTGMREFWNFKLIDLSIALSKAEYIETTLGKSNYIDYTLIGSSINSLFRILSLTEGRLLCVTENYIDTLKESHLYVYIGSKEFKGIETRVPVYSIIREKTTEEKVNNSAEKCNSVSCPLFYDRCYYAWEKGFNDRDKANPQDYIFTLNCHSCGEHISFCRHWMMCDIKYIKGVTHQSVECCHICTNFRNCFNNYHLGRRSREMVTCNKELLQLSLMEKEKNERF